MSAAAYPGVIAADMESLQLQLGANDLEDKELGPTRGYEGDTMEVLRHDEAVNSPWSTQQYHAMLPQHQPYAWGHAAEPMGGMTMAGAVMQPGAAWLNGPRINDCIVQHVLPLGLSLFALLDGTIFWHSGVHSSPAFVIWPQVGDGIHPASECGYHGMALNPMS